MNNFVLKWLRRIGGSMMFIGYFPLASGTVASAVTVALIWLLDRRMPAFFDPSHAQLFWIVSLALIGLSIFLSNDALNVFGKRDPHQIVIDECAGQLITFLLVPLSIRTLVLGFALFRFFDVVKPYPIYRLEELEDGIGVTMDDVAAGALSNISLQAILYLYHIIHVWLGRGIGPL